MEDLNVDRSKQCFGMAFLRSLFVKGGGVVGTLNFLSLILCTGGDML